MEEEQIHFGLVKNQASFICRDLGQETQGLERTSGLRKKTAGIGAEAGGTGPGS